MPPSIAASDHIHRRASTFVDDDVLHGVAGGHRLVDRALELNLAAAAIAGVLGDDGDAAGVVDAIGDCGSGESAEDDRVHGADARAGEQGDGELGRHTHVHGDTVALFNPKRFQAVGELLHFGVEFGVGEAADLARFAFPDDGRFVATRAGEMTVETVIAEVGFAPDEPLGPGQIPLKNFIPGLKPVQLFGDAGPECFGVFNGLLVECFVLLEAFDMGLGAELRRRRKDAIFAKNRIQILTR